MRNEVMPGHHTLSPRPLRGKCFREGGGEQAQGPGGLVSFPRAFSQRADLDRRGELEGGRGTPSWQDVWVVLGQQAALA